MKTNVEKYREKLASRGVVMAEPGHCGEEYRADEEVTEYLYCFACDACAENSDELTEAMEKDREEAKKHEDTKMNLQKIIADMKEYRQRHADLDDKKHHEGLTADEFAEYVECDLRATELGKLSIQIQMENRSDEEIASTIWDDDGEYRIFA